MLSQQKENSKLSLFIRSFIFLIYSNMSMMLYSFIMVGAFIFPLRLRHALIRRFLRTYFNVLKYVCHIDYKVEGLEHIPKDRTGIVMCKHQSAWETLCLPLIFHDPAVIVKRELLWLPFFGWGLAASDPIAINRRDKSSAMQQVISKGKKRLNEGRWVIVFPEGTRVKPGVVGHYKLGGARLAAATGYPVIPIAHNAGRFWAKRQFLKYPGTIRMVIGPPIESKNRSADEILRLTKHWIESTMRNIDSFVHKPPR